MVGILYVFSLLVKNFSFLTLFISSFLRSLIIFMIMTLNSLSGRPPVSTFTQFFWGVHHIPSFGACSSITSFAVFISVYLVGWFHFLILEKWPL